MATRNVDGTLMRYHPRLSLSERIDLYKMKEDEPIVKSTIECARMREYSESIIKKHDHLTTFIVFNRSLCFGIKGTDETIKAHISRSAACVMVNADAAALQNIEFIKNNSYSPDTKHHADLVEKKATSKLAKARKGMNDMPKTPLYTFLYEQQSNSPKITFPSPLVIKKGCLVTTKDHEIGDIIAMEQPFFGASFCDSANMNCANCMKFSMFTLIPCDGCTTSNICIFTSFLNI